MGCKKKDKRQPHKIQIVRNRNPRHIEPKAHRAIFFCKLLKYCAGGCLPPHFPSNIVYIHEIRSTALSWPPGTSISLQSTFFFIAASFIFRTYTFIHTYGHRHEYEWEFTTIRHVGCNRGQFIMLLKSDCGAVVAHGITMEWADDKRPHFIQMNWEDQQTFDGEKKHEKHIPIREI